MQMESAEEIREQLSTYNDPDWSCPLSLTAQAEELAEEMTAAEALPSDFEREHALLVRTRARIRHEYTNYDELLRERLPNEGLCVDVWDSEEPCEYIRLVHRYTDMTEDYWDEECPYREEAHGILKVAGNGLAQTLWEQWYYGGRKGDSK